MLQNTQPEFDLGGNGERILVVDDSRETVRHLAESLLPTLGFDSSYALDGRSALEKIRAESPDLVMLDLNLPQMTGIDVLEALALENYQPPVVLMTGGGSEQSAVDAFRLGVKDYLVKPFTVDEVVETIRRTLEDYQHRPEEAEPTNQQLSIAQNEIRRQKDQLTRLLHISKSIASLTDLNTIIDRVLHTALQQCNAEHSLLWVPNSDQSPIRTYQYTLNAGGIHKHNLPIQNEYFAQVMKSGTLLREASFSEGLDVGMERRARSIIYAPIKLHNQTIGVVGVGNMHAPHAFSEIHELFLDAIADYASIALTNAFTIQRSRSSNATRLRDLYNLVRITHSLVSQPTGKVIQDALFHAYNRWQIEACSVWLSENNQVRFYTNMGIGTDELSEAQLPLGEGFVGYVAETGKWIYSNAVVQHPRHHAQFDHRTGFQTRSILCIPLAYQGRVLGALQLLNRMDGDFNEKDVEQAMSIGAIISIALHNMKVEQLALAA